MSKAKIILAILIVAYTIYFSFVTISRHRAGFSGRFDLGNMEQTVWNTSEGRIFQMTDPEISKISSRLAFHADFLLVLIAPIYKLFPYTETLLIIQSLIVALGTIPTYLIAKYILVGDDLRVVPHADRPGGLSLQKILPIIFAILYLLSPILERANLYDFHSETLGVTFLLFTFYFLLADKIKPFLLFFFLALISKETVSLVLSMICLFGIFKTKHRVRYLSFFIFSLAYFLFMVKIAIPQANAALSQHFALRHFGEGNQSFNDLILNYLKNPLEFFKIIFRAESLAYYFKIFSTTGFLSLLSPFSLIISLPPVLINTLSRDSQFRVMNYQYQATIVPELLISAIYGLRMLQEKLNHHKFSLISLIALISLITLGNFYEFSPLPLIGKNPNLNFLNPFVAIKKIRYWESRVPEINSVTVTNNAGAHFAKRQLLYHFPRKIGEVDYVIIAAKSWQEWVSDAGRDKIIAELKKNPKYKLLDEGDGFWIFQRI